MDVGRLLDRHGVAVNPRQRRARIPVELEIAKRIRDLPRHLHLAVGLRYLEQEFRVVEIERRPVAECPVEPSLTHWSPLIRWKIGRMSRVNETGLGAGSWPDCTNRSNSRSYIVRTVFRFGA